MQKVNLPKAPETFTIAIEPTQQTVWRCGGGLEESRAGQQQQSFQRKISQGANIRKKRH